MRNDNMTTTYVYSLLLFLNNIFLHNLFGLNREYSISHVESFSLINILVIWLKPSNENHGVWLTLSLIVVYHPYCYSSIFPLNTLLHHMSKIDFTYLLYDTAQCNFFFSSKLKFIIRFEYMDVLRSL